MGILIKGLDHFQICVPGGEENTAKSFYLDLLQFVEVEKPEALKENGGFWCSAGEVNLHIGVEAFEKTISKRHPAFLVDDIHEARNVLQKHNVPIKEETPIPGIKRFSFYDPFMNRIEFLQRTSDDSR
ncbi:MAG TPA: VOC family protein [Metabacillus sp.]|nr:VOC family protein [Metabacillus sp.]